MKHHSFLFGTLICTLILLFGPVSPLSAQSASHEVEGMHVTIPATDYKTSRFIEREVFKGKTCIKGKPSSYKKNGEANAGALLQPYAEYEISNKILGGSYNILVYYSVDEEQAPANPRLCVGMNTQQARELALKTNRVPNKYVKANFKVKLLKGKKHTIKIWLPSKGVRVHEIKVLRALFNSKDKSSNE